MANKSIILVTVLVVVLAAAQANAQLLSPVTPVTAVFNIAGIVSCSVNGSVNGTNPVPPFPNAVVQLSCGGNVIASGVTNATGGFSIILTPLQAIINNLLSSCKVVVATPLASCNATLPSTGTLQGTLQRVGNTINGALDIINFIVRPLQFIG